MPYDAKAVANLLIDIGKENGEFLDQMKLQKLVYITHGWSLAITGKALIKDDIQAWQYGPVIPSLYSEFRNCGRNPITDYATDVEINKADFSYTLTPPQVPENDVHTAELARKVWSVYGHYSGPQLSNLTHMPDTPWDKVYKTAPKSSISNQLIKEHFVALSNNSNG